MDSWADNAGEIQDRWEEGDASAMLEVEYWQVVRVLQGFSERRARLRPVPDAPTALEIIAGLAADELPNGPAPSLSDALHALDRVFAGWQAESPPFQRVQTRRLTFALGQLMLLHTILLGGLGRES